jgi:hypothetical protein
MRRVIASAGPNSDHMTAATRGIVTAASCENAATMNNKTARPSRRRRCRSDPASHDEASADSAAR